jgi:hypothetical protein
MHRADRARVEANDAQHPIETNTLADGFGRCPL